MAAFADCDRTRSKRSAAEAARLPSCVNDASANTSASKARSGGADVGEGSGAFTLRAGPSRRRFTCEEEFSSMARGGRLDGARRKSLLNEGAGSVGLVVHPTL